MNTTSMVILDFIVDIDILLLIYKLNFKLRNSINDYASAEGKIDTEIFTQDHENF